jgi:hypothetical protein
LALARLDLALSGAWVPSVPPNRRWSGQIRATHEFATLLVVTTCDRVLWAKSEVGGAAGLPVTFDIHPLREGDLQAQFMFIVGLGWVTAFCAALPSPSYLPAVNLPSAPQAAVLRTLFTASTEPPATFGLLFLARRDVRVGRTGLWRSRAEVAGFLPALLFPALNGGRQGSFFLDKPG